MKRIENRVAGLGDLSETSYGVILTDKFRKVKEDSGCELRGIPASEASQLVWKLISLSYNDPHP